MLFNEEKYHVYLSQEEKLRANRFAFDHLRKHYIIKSGILRTLLGYYLAIDPGEVMFSYGRFGKPFVEQSEEMIHFNLADSGDIVLVGIKAGSEIGVDIEKIKSDIIFKNLEKDILSEEELIFYESLSEEKRVEAFYSAWTHKEALLKLKGLGLRRDPATVKVPLFTLDKPTKSGDDESEEYLKSFYLSGEYLVAIASSQPNFTVNLRHFE